MQMPPFKENPIMARDREVLMLVHKTGARFAGGAVCLWGHCTLFGTNCGPLKKAGTSPGPISHRAVCGRLAVSRSALKPASVTACR